MENRIKKFRNNTSSVNAGPGSNGIWGDTDNNLNFSSENSTNPASLQNYFVPKVVKIPLPRVASTSEQDTGFDLPANAVVLDAYVEVTTLEATGTTKTVDVGLLASESGGDADGFLDGVSVATAGVRQGSLVSGAVTRGAFLKETVTDSGSATVAARLSHVTTAVTARSVSYTLGSNNFAEFVGNLIIVFVEF